MTYGVVLDVAAPVEAYDASHAALMKEPESSSEGLLLHVGRATSGGFQVIEVWETKDQYERFTREVLVPLLERLGGGQGPGPAVQEFEVRGLVIPRGGITI